MFMPCSACCGACTILDDNFNRADSADPGAEWAIETGEWAITEETLNVTEYPAIISSVPFADAMVIESVGYTKTSRVSISWLPLQEQIPSVHRLYLGNVHPDHPDEVYHGYFIQLEVGEKSGAPTIIIRLGAIGGGTLTWLTDELPIGWTDSNQYTGTEDPNPSDKPFTVTLCWEPEDAYGTRDIQKVKATIASFTGAFYTLEGTFYGAPFGIPANHVVLEAIEGYARWDDMRFRYTKPDTKKCPWCGSCLFAADMTTPDDQNTAAYSGSGGTLSRNVTTGAIELTGGSATWLVDVPARNSLSLNYGADWSGSPGFTVNAGSVSVAITKSGSNQLVTPTIDGSLQGGFSVPLSSSTLQICVADEDVTISVGGTQREYASADASGTTNITLTASGAMVSVTEIRVSRTDGEAVSKFSCTPCVLVTPENCSVCPPDPFAPYGAIAIQGEFSIEPKTRKGRAVASGFELNVGDPCVKQSITPADISCQGQEWPSDVIAEVSDTSLTFGKLLNRDPNDIALCTFEYREQLCSNCCETGIGNVGVNAGIYVTLFRTADAIPSFYLAAAARLVNQWPIEGTFGSYVIFDCVEGVVAAIDVDVPAYGFGDYGGVGLAGIVNENILDPWPFWYSDYFTECDKVDFVLTGPGGTLRNLFQTTTYPTELTVHVIR